MTNSKLAVWVVNQYSTTVRSGYGGRGYNLCMAFTNLGANSLLIGCCDHHLHNANLTPGYFTRELNQENFDTLWFSSLFKRAHGLRRKINWFYFACKLLFCAIDKRLVRPDIIIYSSPSLVGFVSAYIVSKRYGAKLIFDFRDVWPKSIIDFMGAKKYNLGIIFLSLLEIFAFNFSDFVTFTLSNGSERVKRKRINCKFMGNDKNDFLWIPNGYLQNDIEKFNKKISLGKLKDNKVFTIGYTGSYGTANDLFNILNAAEILQNWQLPVKFIFYGRGYLGTKLKEFVKARKLNNVRINGFVDKLSLDEVFDEFDCCILSVADKPLYKYGISMNKISEYILAGKPIILCFSGEGDFLREANAAFTCPASNPFALASLVTDILRQPDEKELVAKNAFAIYKSNFGYEKNIYNLLVRLGMHQTVTKSDS